MRKAFLFLLVLMLMAGCAAKVPPAATPAPTMDAWVVAYSSELAWLATQFERCLPAGSGAGVVVEETQNLQPAGASAGILLHWGDLDPQGWQASVLGTDRLAVIVHPENALKTIGLEDLERIYHAEASSWSEIDAQNHGPITVWVYPPHLGVQRAWNEALLIAGRPETGFQIAPDVDAMLQAVGSDPGAIGYIPAAWLDGQVKELAVEGWSSQPIPIVLLTRDAPGPAQQEWFACLSNLVETEVP